MFEKIFNPIFGPLLDLGYFWAILIISFVLTALITIVYKYATDQELMKRLKKEMKDLQKEMKQFKDNPKKAMSHQKKVMEKNMQYMKHSLKPTLYTFIPIIIIFGWLNAHMAYMPLSPNDEFSVTAQFEEGSFGDIVMVVEGTGDISILSDPTQEVNGESVSWRLKGQEGSYVMSFTYQDRVYDEDSKGNALDLVISSEREYAEPEKSISNSNLEKIVVGNEKVAPLKEIGFGWSPNWIWTYILLSLIFSIGIRKALKIS